MYYYVCIILYIMHLCNIGTYNIYIVCVYVRIMQLAFFFVIILIVSNNNIFIFTA